MFPTFNQMPCHPQVAYHHPFPQFGRTRYHYNTPDGSPPNQGAPPTGSSLDQVMQSSPFGSSGNCVPGSVHPWGFPNQPAGPQCTAASSGWFCAPPAMPPPVFYPSCPPQPHPCSHQPRPPTVRQYTSQPFTSSNEPPQEPLQGNRVKGQLLSLDGGKAGVVTFKDNLTIHLFTENVLEKYPPVNNMVSLPPFDHLFSVQHVPCEMTVYEFIEQIDGRKRANKVPPYNLHGYGYPDYGIGIQELLEEGNNQFRLGSRIMLTDRDAGEKLGRLWHNSVGNAGQQKPVYIVRLPV